MKMAFRKWAYRKDHYEALRDITSEPYPIMNNGQVIKEIKTLLKNSWLSKRVEAKLIDLEQKMADEKKF